MNKKPNKVKKDNFKLAWFTLPDSFKIPQNPCQTVLIFSAFYSPPLVNAQSVYFGVVLRDGMINQFQFVFFSFNNFSQAQVSVPPWNPGKRPWNPGKRPWNLGERPWNPGNRQTTGRKITPSGKVSIDVYFSGTEWAGYSISGAASWGENRCSRQVQVYRFSAFHFKVSL